MRSSYTPGKVSCPVLPPALLKRPALVARLKAIIDQIERDRRKVAPFHYQLLLLRAPTGYGKTTLLAELAQQIPLSCCWYIFDQTDSEALPFLRCLVLSLRQRFPKFGASLDEFIESASASEGAHLSAEKDYSYMLKSIIEAIEQEIPERFVWIFCNYQHINSSLIVNKLIDQLLEHLSDHGIFIIESQAMPALNLATFVAQRKMVSLDSSDIRFSAQELQALAQLQEVLPLNEQEAAYLAKTFDGWIAGILLGTRIGKMHLSWYTVHEDITALNKQELFSYLVHDIFGREPEILQFLKEVIILQEMTPYLCSQLADIADASPHLIYLERQGLFVTKSSSGTAFICHPLVRDLLREDLQQSNHARFSQLHRKAAELFRLKQQYDQAIYHAHKCNDHTLAAQLICQAYRPLIDQGRLATLEDWLQEIAAETIQCYPQLLLVEALLSSAHGKQEQILALLDEAERLLSEPTSCCEEAEIPILQAEIALARSQQLCMNGQYTQAYTLCQQTLIGLPANERDILAKVHLHLGVCAYYLGDITASIQELQLALQVSWHCPQSLQRAQIHTYLANIYHLTGNDALSEHHRARAIQSWEVLQDEHGKITNLIAIGAAFHRRGNSAKAETLLNQALLNAQQNAQQAEAYALISLGDIYQDQNKYNQALVVIEDGLARARQMGHHYLTVYSLCALATSYLMMDDPSTAHTLLKELKSRHETFSPYLKALYHMTEGTILLYTENHAEAIALLQMAAQTFNRIFYKREQIQCLLRLANAYQRQNQKEEMTECLQRVLEATTQHGHEQIMQLELQRMPHLQRAIQNLPDSVQLRTLLFQAPDSNDTSSLAHLQPAQPLLAASSGQTEYLSLSQSSTRLQIHAFGEPRVVLEERPITHWRMARAMELFFFLLDRNKPVHKEQIIAALWSEEEIRTDQTFRSTVYYLRKVLGEQCIIAQASCYVLDLRVLYGQSVSYDVSLFLNLVQQAKQIKNNIDELYQTLTRMIDLYRGDYLQSFYSTWCTFRRDELRRAYMDARHKLALLAWRREHIDESIMHWQYMLAVDNCREEAYQGLMLCYLRQKKRGEALRQYERCVAVLREEMGVTPGLTLQRLYQRLTDDTDTMST